MDAITLKRIEQAHPKFRDKMREDYIAANNLLGKGVRLRFAYVYRSPAEQTALYNQRPKVTNAKAWQSIHNYALAFDIVLLYDKNGDGVFETVSWDMVKDGDNDKQADWMEVTNYFISQGWESGAKWKNFKDFPHFQIPGYSWQTLKAKIDKGDTITENGIVYPKL
jgi:peptidoglycan L-alanyl-D-glutamate endopeptidase CwlK